LKQTIKFTPKPPHPKNLAKVKISSLHLIYPQTVTLAKFTPKPLRPKNPAKVKKQRQPPCFPAHQRPYGA
jgi:hypothetical protein